MFIWIIVEKEDNKPIIAASTKENAEQQLFDYMGYIPNEKNDDLEYLGYKKIEYSEFEDDFTGIYTFKGLYPTGFGENLKFEWEIQNFWLYSVYLDQPQK